MEDICYCDEPVPGEVMPDVCMVCLKNIPVNNEEL